jgi:hypothetical protein
MTTRFTSRTRSRPAAAMTVDLVRARAEQIARRLERIGRTEDAEFVRDLAQRLARASGDLEELWDREDAAIAAAKAQKKTAAKRIAALRELLPGHDLEAVFDRVPALPSDRTIAYWYKAALERGRALDSSLPGKPTPEQAAVWLTKLVRRKGTKQVVEALRRAKAAEDGTWRIPRQFHKETGEPY